MKEGSVVLRWELSVHVLRCFCGDVSAPHRQ
jgi:hypothetical protein